MQRVQILQKLKNCGVIAVVRSDKMTTGLRICEALVAGGITGLEITFSIPSADLLIKQLTEQYQTNEQVVIGAGTVLDAITARIAILAGARYIVSPSFDMETAKICNLYQIPYLPGCMTITEVKQALTAGVDIVKLFPGSAFGPSFIKALKAPLPHANVMPTGGVSLDNMDEWIRCGAVTVGVGGNLLEPAKTGNYKEITRQAAQYVLKFRTIQEELAK